MIKRIKTRLLAGAVLLYVAAIVAPGAQAETWIFNPSYYSHDPVSQVRIGRQFAGGPVFTRSQGEYVNTGYRRLHSAIQVRGQTFDQINMWESWIQGGAKY